LKLAAKRIGQPVDTGHAASSVPAVGPVVAGPRCRARVMRAVGRELVIVAELPAPDKPGSAVFNPRIPIGPINAIGN